MLCVCVYIYIYIYMGFSGGSDSKESTCNVRDQGSIPWLGFPSPIPGEGNSNPFQLFLPEEFNGRRNLEGYSPWGCRLGHN